MRRLGLLVFGAAFVVLFLVLAIAEGIGDPAIPQGDIAVVENVPGDAGAIGKADFEHALELAAAQAHLKIVPKPGEGQYEELKKIALENLLKMTWIEGLGAEVGISVTPSQVVEELRKVKKESFKNEAAYKKFLKESHFTPADVNRRIKLQVIGKQIQDRITEGAPKPSESEITDYYEEAKPEQFTQKASRSIRLILNKDRKKAEEAKALLEKDHSAASWKKVAKKYSEDPETKTSGGLRTSPLTEGEGITEDPLNAAVFEAPEKQLEGPVKTTGGYYVFEVESSTPEDVKALKDVKSQIESTLSQQAQQESFSNFEASFASTWRSRTFCAVDYMIELCANFKGSGRPTSPPPEPACFEANPKGGLPAAGCPAAVAQLRPAVPGSVSVVHPKGEPKAQGPLPAPPKQVEGAEATSTVPLTR